MKTIGLVGGVDSGKSRVLEYLEKKHQGYPCSTDEIGKELQKKGNLGYQKMVTCFGKDILDDRGEILRERVAQIIFRNEDARKRVNAIIHPLVKEEVKNRMKEEREKGRKFFFIESALFFEDNYSELCEEIWFVSAEKKHRMERLRKERGYSSEKIEGIMQVQLLEEEFQKRSHRILKNDGDFSETEKQLDQWMEGMKKG